MKKIFTKKLCKLKVDKSPGRDMMHPRVLYETKDEISYPLFLIFNKSLQIFMYLQTW